MELDPALEWATSRSTGVLITLRADGRPQSSDINYLVQDGTFLISVTAGRAKTANMARDPRVVLHLTEPSSWSYASFDALADLSPVAERTDDETVDRLVAQYRAASGGEHPDWDEFRRAMVEDRRLLVRLTPASVVGQLHG